jgi:hypothetical protein
MDQKNVIQLAKKYLCDNIELEALPDEGHGIGFYSIDPGNEILVRFSFFSEANFVGGDKFVAVSKKDGTVRFVGRLGE